MASFMDDPRVQQYIGDGMQFMEKHTNEFDVIITDSSDPQGNSSINPRVGFPIILIMKKLSGILVFHKLNFCFYVKCCCFRLQCFKLMFFCWIFPFCKLHTIIFAVEKL